MTALHSLTLESFHQLIGAKFAPFAGYRMPIQYSLGVKGEHLHTRDAVGLFDVSHMGQLLIQGPASTEALERLIPAALQEMTPGQIRYSQLTLDTGGILDDLMLTRWDTDIWGLVVNGACKHTDMAHFNTHLPDAVNMTYIDDHALIAIQGPQARLALSRIIPEAQDLLFMRSLKTSWKGCDITLSCCGYTGEDGYEVSIANDQARDFAEALTDLDETTWVGLGARNSLRLETGLCLYGNDLTPDTTPIEADLLWSIQKRRRTEGGFLGAETILKQINDGAPRKRVGLAPADGRTPLRDHTVLKNAAGDIVGEITSGGFGPTHNGPVSMGYVTQKLSTLGTELIAEVRGKALACTVCDPMFVQQRYRRSL
ncbi:MAG: glycine cleavage system aminomethyltransferase GcvT [Litorivicinaceae bacterium]|nr:MAG: glycine cleavage system aminomethyltransferase GcvT [Litorivicinaceae bacterium]